MIKKKDKPLVKNKVRGATMKRRVVGHSWVEVSFKKE